MAHSTHNPVRYFKHFGCISAFKVSCRLFLTLFNTQASHSQPTIIVGNVKDARYYIPKTIFYVVFEYYIHNTVAAEKNQHIHSEF